MSKKGALLLGLASVAGLILAPPAAARPAEATTEAAEPPRELVLRAGTEIPLALVAALSSKRARQGQRVELEITADVRVDNQLILPGGTRAVGEVSRVVAKGMFGKAGKLRVRALFVEIGGSRIRLDGEAADKGKSGAAPVAAAALLVGASAGFISGTSAVLPAGSAIKGYVYRDVALIVRPAPIAQSGR